MTYTRTSPILGYRNIDVDAIGRWAVSQGAARQYPLHDYLHRIKDGAEKLGIDPLILIAQSDLETDTWRSRWWGERLNPADLGITGDPEQNEQSQVFADGEAAAMGHLAHMHAYVFPNSFWPIPESTSWLRPREYDRRYDKVFEAGYHADTLNDLTNTWAIDDNYADKIADRANQLLTITGDEVTVPEGEDEQMPTPVEQIPFGRVPHPPFEWAIVNKPVHTGSAYGYIHVPGGRKNIGVVHHEWLGVGSLNFHLNFFACPNGERCTNALVDYFIHKDGTIYMLNDPAGVRAGWANGGGVGLPGGLEGDGPAFYARFGADGINNKLVSIEYQKLGNENFTPEQIESGGRLAAYFHDQDGQLGSEHPYTNKYGLVTSFLHFEFGTTTCGKNELDDITKVQAVTRREMMKYQEGSIPDNGPSVPPLPAPDLPGGISLLEAQKRFGVLTRHNRDGSKDEFPFDPKGPISLSWAHRCAIAGEWPKAEDWYQLNDSGDQLHLITFENDWRLIKPSERAGFGWMEFSPVQALEDAA